MDGKLVGTIILIAALLIWAITFTILWAKKKAACNAMAPSSIVATEEGVKFRPGVLLQNGDYAFVFQTDGNLAVFKHTNGVYSVSQATAKQRFTDGVFRYFKSDDATSLKFVSTELTKNEWETAVNFKNTKEASTLRLTDEGALEIVGKDPSKETSKLNLNLIVEAPPAN